MNIRSLALAAAVGGVVFTAGPAGACFWPPPVCAMLGSSIDTPEPVSAEPEPPPVELETYVRDGASQPAPRAAARQDSGPVAEKTADKPKPRKKQAAAPKPKPPEPEPPKPALLKPEPPEPPVAQSFAAQASYAFDATALVRVVSADELNEIDLSAPPESIATETTGVGVRRVQVVDPIEVNDLDRRADAIRTATLEAHALVPETQRGEEESPSWLQRTMSRLGAAFATVSAAVRSLFG